MLRYFRRRRFFYYVGNRKNLRILRVLLFIVVFSFLIIAADARFRPVVADLANAKAQNIALRKVNEAVSLVISEHFVDYEDLLIMEKDEKGAVTALRTNMAKINLLKTEVSKKVIDALSNIDSEELGIPLGNLTNWNVLTGRGPRIPFRVTPYGSAETNFLSEFTSSGINQTRHRIVMENRVWVSIMMPGASVRSEIKSNVSVAETILIGSVPNSYTYIDDQRQDDTLSKWNDYKTK